MEENDEVVVWGRWRSGTLKASKLENLATDELVRTPSLILGFVSGFIIPLIVLGLFLVGIVSLLAGRLECFFLAVALFLGLLILQTLIERGRSRVEINRRVHGAYRLPPRQPPDGRTVWNGFEGSSGYPPDVAGEIHRAPRKEPSASSPAVSRW